jgi:hypothetical protein
VQAQSWTKHAMNTSFNIVDLSPYHGDEDIELRTTLFQEEGLIENPRKVSQDIPWTI